MVALTLPPAAGTTNDLPTHDPTVGTMAGQASTDGGAAQYHIPIVVPPGRAGMQPDLALAYNSRSGNGVMGMGWSISGLSSIHRCPQTPEQDGQVLGVSYTNNDRLCLDGQRLVLVAGSYYGAPNAEYRTEVDSYARITQVGGDLTGASTCFRVEQKGGRVLHYGAVTGAMTNGALSAPNCAASSANSTVVPSGAPAPLSWLVEKVEDRVGNNQLYQYTNYGYGEVLLSTVSYTGYGTTAGNRTVTLAYQARTNAASNPAPTDVGSSYLAGGLTMQTQALASITTAVAGATVRTYTPTYSTSQYNGRLLMTSVSECASGSCHLPTQFSYSDGAVNFTLGAMTNVGGALPSDLQAWSFSSIGDLDGDGTPEYMVLGLKNYTSQTFAYLAQVAANGQITAVDLTGTPFYPNAALYSIARGDVDGDGRTDFSIVPAYTTDSNGNLVAANGNLQLATWAGATHAPLNAGASPQATFNSTFLTVTTNIPVDSNTQVFIQDMNGDGKPDIVVAAPDASCSSGRGVFVYLNQLTTSLSNAAQPVAFVVPSGHLICLNSVNNGGTYNITTQSINHIADFDGDGIPDMFISDSNAQSGASNFNGVYLVKPTGTGTSATLSTSFIACGASMGLASSDCQLTASGVSGVARWMDVNGDGLEDWVTAKPSAIGGNDQWVVHLNQGHGTYAAPINTGSSAGLSDKTYNGSYRYLNKLSPVDADSDGKPDIVYPSQTQGFALKVCTMQKVGPLASSGECPTDNSLAAAPIRAAAASNLQCPALACPEEPGKQGDPTLPNLMNMPRNNSAPGYPFAWDGYAAAGLYTSNTFAGGQPADHSAYHLDMLKFIQSGPTTITAQVVPTSLVSGVNNTRDSSVSNDMGGTGLETIPTLLGCSGQPVVITNSGNSDYYAVCDVVGDGTYGPALLPDGTATSNFQPTPKVTYSAPTPPTITPALRLYANFNQGAALSGPAARNSLPSALAGGCASYAPLPGLMYSAKNGLGDTALWDFDTLAEAYLCTRDGLPEYFVDGTYTDSRHYYFSSSMPVVGTMLQSNGIGGNTGTRSAIYSYGDAMYNHFGRGFQGFHTISTENASSTASRRLQTTTTFNQKFPLVGRIAGVSTSPAPSSGIASHPIHAETVNYSCIQSNASLAACATGDGLATPTGGTVYRPAASSQTSNEYDLNSGQATSHSSTTSSVFDVYGNVLTQAVTRGDDAAGGQFVGSHTTTTTNTITPSTTNWMIDLPTETQVQASITYARALPSGASAPTQILDTQYAWNADRTPNTKVAQPQSVIGDTNQQSTTAYSYPSPSYGLPSQVQVTGPSLPLARTMSYGYSSDGYFVATTTNGLNQTVTTITQASDGQPTSVTDANNLITGTTYDVFGRATQITHQKPLGSDIEPPINIAVTNCNGGCAGPGSDANELFAVYRSVSTQQGYPTKVTWVDLLSRPVKAAQAGFQSTTSSALQYAYSAALTDYDENGAVAMQSTPYYVGTDTPYFTGYTFDALNRPLTKVTQNTCSGGNMTTAYGYTGRQTNITVSGTCPGGTANTTIQMSRSTNALGQLMQTVDAASKTTSYWTEPLGHVVAITDVEGNLTTASYNALGQRLQSNDPDQGTWTFSYNALGELNSQTDARGVVTQINSRDAVGRIVQRTQTPPASPPTYIANETLVDAYTYDPTNARGQLGSITRTRAGTQTWSETYAYDTDARPITTTTVINDNGNPTFNSTVGYDSQGRVSTQTYPSGLIVQRSYTAYGQLDALSNQQTGYVYWVAQGEDAWGHTNAEQYPGVITGTHQDFAATGQTMTLGYTGALSDTVSYAYDSFGNLASQQRSAQGATNTETYQYDGLQRLTQASRSIGGSVTYGYSASGNLTQKSDYASSYTYASANAKTNGCGPHAANAAGAFSYGCDPNGNVISGAITAVYDADNHPRSIARAGAGTMTWGYSPSGMAVETSSQGTRYFGPNGYEQVGIGAGAKQIHEVGPVIVTRTNGTDQITVVLRDRLGSTIATVDSNVPTLRMFDAFGKARNGDMSDRPNGTLNLADTIHGFTKHDHADDVQLIHMGGRVYDYQLGRFLNVDPLIGNPANSQSLNPYSYIGNNPLSGIDPTGYQCVGSHIESQTCADTGAASIQVGSPSVTAKNDAMAAHLEAQVDRLATTRDSFNNGAAGGQGAQVLQTNLGNTATGMANSPSAPMAQPGFGKALAKAGFYSAMYALNSMLPSDEAQERAEMYAVKLADAKNEAVNSSFGASLGHVFGASFGMTVSAVGGGEFGEARMVETATLDASTIRFSQSNVRSTLPKIVESMKANGWLGEPIDVVRMPDGGLTAVDNTRLAAASLTNTPVQARIRGFNEAFPATRAGGNLQGATWGEAVTNRIGEQQKMWQRLYPNGSPFTGVKAPGFSP